MNLSESSEQMIVSLLAGAKDDAHGFIFVDLYLVGLLHLPPAILTIIKPNIDDLKMRRGKLGLNIDAN